MRVCCKKKILDEAQKAELSRLNIYYGGDVLSDLDYGRSYLVYSLAEINGVKAYLLYDTLKSSDYELWGWYPEILFEMVDDRLSCYWSEYLVNDNENDDFCVTKIWTHPEFAKLRDLYVGVCERRGDIVSAFEKQKKAYEEEFN